MLRIVLSAEVIGMHDSEANTNLLKLGCFSDAYNTKYQARSIKVETMTSLSINNITLAISTDPQVGE